MVGLSCMNVSRCLCHTNRPSMVLNRCSMLSCLTPYMSSWMFSMSSFLHRLYALPSSRTTFAQQFQRVSSRFYAFVRTILASRRGNVQNENVESFRMFDMFRFYCKVTIEVTFDSYKATVLQIELRSTNLREKNSSIKNCVNLNIKSVIIFYEIDFSL